MRNSKERNEYNFLMGEEVFIYNRKCIILAGPVKDYHGNNYYWVQEEYFPPSSVIARNIFLLDEDE